MDRFIDTVTDPKILLAAAVGWAARGLLIERSARHASRDAAGEMAGTIAHRQFGVAKKHAVSRITALADDRTKQLVDAFLPRARSKSEQRVVQLTIPE